MSAKSVDRDRVLKGLLGPDEHELTCEECFDRLDVYGELQLSGAQADARIPGMRAHLGGCPACDEDYESLLAFVRAVDRGGSSEET